MTLPANGSYAYSYDGLKRLNTRALKLNNSAFINRSYCYLPGSGTNATTMLVSSVTNSRANGSNISSYTYGYDNVGNITSVSGSTVANYSYDNLGQLRTETYGGKTYTYSYDTAGNIVSVSDGTTTKNYVYGDSSWKDLLTSYNGGTINYDGIGNPTKWYDGTNFTWVNGRRLASAVNSSTGVNNSYTYDADGLRLTKTVNGVQHRYVWQGSQLVAEYYGGTELEFFYDESGAPYAFSYKANASATPVMYYYVTNLQGDVTNIVDASGNVLASYSYNAWGKVLTATGSMAAINPIRYRGYYYDSDTELYYLQSRYYDPEICRFLNADSYASTGQGIFGTNMFAYCLNNPVSCLDSTGKDVLLAILCGFGVFLGVSLLSAFDHAYNSKKNTHNSQSVDGDAAKEVYAYSSTIRQELEEFKGKRPHVHHIVPKENFSGRSQTTQNQIKELHQALADANIDRYYNPFNPMIISEKTHAKVHSNEYIAHIHRYILGTDGSREEIYLALFKLRIEIAAIDKFASGY